MLSSTIYQITTPSGKFYVGSTVTFPKQRWHVHKSNARKNGTSKLYKQMRQEGIDLCKFSILEQGDWNTETLKAKEDHWIHKLEPPLNTHEHSNNKGRYPEVSLKDIWNRKQV